MGGFYKIIGKVWYMSPERSVITSYNMHGWTVYNKINNMHLERKGEFQFRADFISNAKWHSNVTQKEHIPWHQWGYGGTQDKKKQRKGLETLALNTIVYL